MLLVTRLTSLQGAQARCSFPWLKRCLLAALTLSHLIQPGPPTLPPYSHSLSVCLSVCMSVCLSLTLSLSVSLSPSVFLSVSLSICLCLSVCLSVSFSLFASAISENTLGRLGWCHFLATPWYKKQTYI